MTSWEQDPESPIIFCIALHHNKICVLYEKRPQICFLSYVYFFITYFTNRLIFYTYVDFNVTMAMSATLRVFWEEMPCSFVHSINISEKKRCLNFSVQ